MLAIDHRGYIFGAPSTVFLSTYHIHDTINYEMIILNVNTLES